MRLSEHLATPWVLAAWAGLAAVGGVGLFVAATVGAVPGWAAWIVATQRELHAGLAAALDAVRSGGVAAAWPLVGLSFGYGVFHAAGPGHGKVVVSTYLASHESRLGQAIVLTSLAALAQAVTAIVAVHVAVTVLELGLRQARTSMAELDAVSFGLVAALGLGLSLRAGLALARRVRGQAADDCPNCGHGHAHGRGHGPWAALGVVLAVGIRPCAGGVVVLLLAYAADLRLVGILAVLAMAVGTALTTGVLATLAVLARRQAVRFATWLPGGDGRLAAGLDVVALAGGLVLLALGVILLQASLVPAPAHPFR